MYCFPNVGNQRAHSISNQLGVTMVARGSMDLYIGITSGATYKLPASPITADIGRRSKIRSSFG
jgi:hypothetical protein